MQIAEERYHRITPNQESCYLLPGFTGSWNGGWAFTESKFHSNGKKEETPPLYELKAWKQSCGARQRGWVESSKFSLLCQVCRSGLG